MKQTIEIDVPDGMEAVYKDNKIEFIPIKEYWSYIKTFHQAFEYVSKYLPEYDNLIHLYHNIPEDTYEDKIVRLRIIVAALTHNEKRHLTTGDKWYPVVQFCRPKDKKNCWGDVLIGTIESEGEKYSVVGGSAASGANAGLGAFSSPYGVSRSTATVGFRSVSSKEIAQHISTYFGKLLFDVHYGGTNCDWKWIDDK